jgi:hypothetical protein
LLNGSKALLALLVFAKGLDITGSEGLEVSSRANGLNVALVTGIGAEFVVASCFNKVRYV